MKRASQMLLAFALMAVVAGVGELVLSQTVHKNRFSSQLDKFTEDYKKPASQDGYNSLFEKARQTQEELLAERMDYVGFIGAACLALGLFLLVWVYDRQRLIKRVEEVEKQLEKTKNSI